jgi:predicted lipoprotein with Yx(FWY)xxD motif
MMTRLLLVISCAVGVLFASACSSGGASGHQLASSPPASPEASARNAAEKTATSVGIATAHNLLGTILTDTHGRTVYLFEADSGPTSTCTGACAVDWPPLTSTGAPVVGTGVSAALLTTSPRPGGTMQLTYNGHPLYFYNDDRGPGATMGQGLNLYGGDWYVLSPAGVKIDTD